MKRVLTVFRFVSVSINIYLDILVIIISVREVSTFTYNGIHIYIYINHMLLLLSIYLGCMRIAPFSHYHMLSGKCLRSLGRFHATRFDSILVCSFVLWTSVCVCDREIDAPIRAPRFYRFSNYIIFKIKITHISNRTRNNTIYGTCETTERTKHSIVSNWWKRHT